jgi:hypothetical protein
MAVDGRAEEERGSMFGPSKMDSQIEKQEVTRVRFPSTFHLAKNRRQFTSRVVDVDTIGNIKNKTITHIQ